MGIFDGVQDESLGLVWMLKKLGGNIKALDKERKKAETDKNKTMSQKKEDRLSASKELVLDINSRIAELKVDSSTPDQGFSDEVWDRFIFCMTGNDRDYYTEKPDKEPPYLVGEWDQEVEQDIEFGWSDCHIKTEIPKKGSTRDFATHYYSEPPPPAQWNLIRVVQKGRAFLIGSVEVGQLDAFCSVPQLPKEMDSTEAAKRVLNKKKGARQWQRRVDRDRVGGIKRFIRGSEDNLIANSVILYVPDEDDSVTFEKRGRVVIDPSKYLSKLKDGRYYSRRGKKDRRPIWLIDGQHRVRGLAQAENAVKMKVPVILFPSDFKLSEAAKIFSEINTLQVKLDALHTLFMQHRFSIASTKKLRDFTLPWKDERGNVVNVNSRANHMAYECAAALAKHEGGALFNRIQFLNSNSSRTTIMKANSWVDYARKWFLDGGPYSPDRPETMKWINEEVGNFFEAIKKTCNHGEWKKSNASNPERPRWAKGAKHKGVIQTHSSSKALIEIYTKAWAKARAGGAVASDEVVPISRFVEVLSPLRWCDWLNPEVERIYKGAGEPPRTSLILWMKTAIDHGVTYGYDEVMNAKMKSLPGRGFLAPPGKGVLSKIDGPEWPEKGKTITFRAEQPPHTFATAAVRVTDRTTGIDRVEVNARVKDGAIEYKLKYQPWMADSSEIEFRISWSNRVPPRGFSNHIMKKT